MLKIFSNTEVEIFLYKKSIYKKKNEQVKKEINKIIERTIIYMYSNTQKVASIFII